MRKLWLLLSLLVMIIILTACGSKGEDEVLDDLADKLKTMGSYKAEMNLSLQTGQEPQDFRVEVWHKKPDFYRISLTQEKRDITQIILRNEEGVFVLTPHLNKSFRFQSNWPENQGLIYLYESLIKDILSDENRTFSTEGDHYLFETAAHYQNKTSAQKIWLSKDLKVKKVEVLDEDLKVKVSANVMNMEFDLDFEDDAFDMQRNLQSALTDALPTMVSEQDQAQGSFGIYYPTYFPPNVDLAEEEEVMQDGNPVVILRYTGDYNFSLIQERPKAKTVYKPVGEPVDLGFTVGVLGERSLEWTYDGIDFLLYGEGLPAEEMTAIARSVMGQVSK